MQARGFLAVKSRDQRKPPPIGVLSKNPWEIFREGPEFRTSPDQRSCLPELRIRGPQPSSLEATPLFTNTRRHATNSTTSAI